MNLEKTTDTNKSIIYSIAHLISILVLLVTGLILIKTCQYLISELGSFTRFINLMFTIVFIMSFLVFLYLKFPKQCKLCMKMIDYLSWAVLINLFIFSFSVILLSLFAYLFLPVPTVETSNTYRFIGTILLIMFLIGSITFYKTKIDGYVRKKTGLL